MARSSESFDRTAAAREYFQKNLAENRREAETFHQMLGSIRDFTKAACARVIVSKCMDGRVHTNNHKGLPPTFAINRRSQGSVIDVTRGNKELWDIIELAALEASSNGTPLLVLMTGHRGEIASGCAAHKREWDDSPAATDNRARQSAREQAAQLGKLIREDAGIKVPSEVLSGMTNTDTGGMELYRNGELIFDAGAIIRQKKLRLPHDVFEGEFAFEKIADERAHEIIRGKNLKALLDGEKAPYFDDTRVRIALEAYLMQSIASGKHPGEDVIRRDILEQIQQSLDDRSVLQEVRPFLTYVMAANLAHATHCQNRNDRLAESDPDELKRLLSHGELKLAFSYAGHDIEPPNSLILVKPGGGDDVKSVQIGRDVLLQNLKEMGREHSLPPLVHINIEVTEPIQSWRAYASVVARMRTKLGIIGQVFKNHDPRLLTTYSYREGVQGVARNKQFFPLNADTGDASIVIDPSEDLGQGMISEATFDPQVLQERERRYTERGQVDEK